MVAQLQPLRQFSDGDLIAFRKPFDGQQSLMLLRRDASRLRRCLAEMDEFPQRVANRGERFLLCLAQLFGLFHGGYI